MSLFDSASLVVTPNGYKEDKLYSIKPTDGSGDLVVTRATTATRVNSDGLIEQVPYNLLQYSQQIGTSPWAYSAADVNLTSTSIISPSGSADSIRVTNTTANGSVPFYQLFTSLLNTYTYSIYIKKDTNRYFGLILTSGASTQNRYGVYFDLQNGVVHQVFNTSTPLTNTSNSITDVGNGWYRCSITATCESAVYVVGQSTNNGTLALNPLTGDLTNATTGIVYVWGAQAVTGTSAKEYFPTTDRLNVPRLDYTNSTCPSILVEPQRTNICTYSEQFDNAAWTKFSSSVTANSVISPDGTQNADKLIALAVNSDHGVYQLPVVTLGASYTYSVFAKAGEYNFLRIADGDGNGAFFNLSNGTIVGSLSANPTIISIGNGWYKCSMTALTSGTSTLMALVVCQSGTTAVFTGDGTSGIYIYGAQLEAGSYATSYIPTIASSVTRNADVISKTGISSLIGQTEGTIFVDVILGNENAEMYLILQNILGNVIEDSIYIQRNTNELKFVGWDGYDLNWNISGGSFTTGQRVKIAAAYKANDIVLYVNGTQIGTDSVASIPPTTSLALGYFPYTPSSEAERAKNIKSVSIWKERLSNETLAQLTTI